MSYESRLKCLASSALLMARHGDYTQEDQGGTEMGMPISNSCYGIINELMEEAKQLGLYDGSTIYDIREHYKESELSEEDYKRYCKAWNYYLTNMHKRAGFRQYMNKLFTTKLCDLPSHWPIVQLYLPGDTFVSKASAFIGHIEVYETNHGDDK